MKNYDKNYYEKYAMLSLEYCYNPDWSDFFHRDRPDWQNDNRGIGIEVTRAITKEDGIFQSQINNLMGSNRSPSDVIAILSKVAERLNINAELFDVDGSTVISQDMNMDHLMLLVKNSIKRKQGKFTGYQKFSENYLYIFTHTSLMRDDELLLNLKALDLSCFGLYFFNCIDNIYCLDPAALTISEYPVSYEQLKMLKRNSAEYADNKA